jgi:LPXTG-motif cell wall-anchored protein
MFKSDKKEVFSFRKYKGYGLASAVIAAFFFASSVSADVVNNGDGTTTLSNDKASVVVESSKFKDDNEKSATELFNEGSYETETVTTGKESVNVESSTTVKYQTEDGEQIAEDVTVSDSETKELDYKVTGRHGKEYTGDNSATSNVDSNLEKKAVIENDGKKYEYVRTETTVAEESTLTDTAFNDVNVKASVQGMHNEDGSIKYDKIENGTRVWVLEELEDGSYGKYALIENAQNLNDDQIREAAKTATSKFSKAEVDAKGGFQATDSVVVYETNTYAARKQMKIQYGKDFYFVYTAGDNYLRKSYIDDIYQAGLEGLEKKENKYFYKGKEVVTVEDSMQSNNDQPNDNYYFKSLDRYVLPITYYNVISDFLIANPESPIFAGKAEKVFWNSVEESYYLTAFVARLLNESFNSKYQLTVDTENFTDKPIETKSDNSRPTEKKTYSFVKTELNGDEESYFTSTHNNEDDMWKQEISLSYSVENVERVRNFIKGYQSLNGWTVTDPFNGKESSDVTSQEYVNAVFNKINSTYFTTMKDQFTPEQIKELRSNFGDAPFMMSGFTIQTDDENSDKPVYSFANNDTTVYRNSLGVVTENTEEFTYHDVITPLRAYRLNADENIVRHIYAEIKKGSVVATYSDEEGNKLVDDVNVKTDEYAGEDYRTEAKTIRPIYEVETVNGLTKTTITRYELISTPANANGQVVAETTIVVPYVYRKVVTVDIKGSVIATYKDEEGNILASEEKVATNESDGTYYAAASKPIQASASSKITENGREVTLITYELIKTPDNETGEVVGGETLVVPYVYRKVVTNKLVPNNPPVVEEETLKVTRFHTDQGEELKSDVAGFEDAPNIIGDYQFTGTTELNEGNDVQTHIYTKIVTEIPNEAPILEVPELKATRYQTEEGTEIKDTEEGFVNAPSIIGDYQFTGTTEMNEGNDVQTHIYTKIVTEVPNEAPKVDDVEAKVTRYMLEDRETEIAEWKIGFEDAPKIIGDYQYTGTTETNESGDVQTHIYTKIVTEIPNEAPKVELIDAEVTRYMLEDRETEIADWKPGLHEHEDIIGQYQYTGVTDIDDDGFVRTHIYKLIEKNVPGDAPVVEIPELKVTRYTLEDGIEIKDAETGFVNAPNTIGDYQFTGVTNMNEGNDVQTHIYKPIETEIPRESLVLDKIEYKMTRYVDEQGNELTLFDFGLREPKAIEDYVFTGRTDSNEAGDVITHVYRKVEIETKVPGDAPQVDIPELRLTRHVNEKGEELLPIEEGSNGPRKTIGDYEYTGRTDVEGGVTTHVYAPIRYEIPGDAPQYDIPELKVTRHVDEKGKELIEIEKGNQPPRKTIGDHEYTGRTTEKDGITTHVYVPIKHEIPGDAPQVDVPELKVTRYVNEKGEEIKESDAGFIDAPKTIGKYEFTGKTEFNEGKDVQTHIYKLVEKPVTPETPNPRTPKRDIPEPKKPETPQPEAPKPIETSKSNDSKQVVVESVDQPQFVKDELPKTGETNSNLALVGVSLLTALGLIGFAKRKRED